MKESIFKVFAFNINITFPTRDAFARFYHLWGVIDCFKHLVDTNS